MLKRELEEKVVELEEKIEDMQEELEGKRVGCNCNEHLDYMVFIRKFLDQILGKDHLESFNDLSEAKREAEKLRYDFAELF